jgi:hypothetical protein
LRSYINIVRRKMEASLIYRKPMCYKTKRIWKATSAAWWKNVTGIKSLGYDQDLFGAGLNSLHVMTIVKQPRASVVGVPQEQIGPSTGIFEFDNCRNGRGFEAGVISNGTTNGAPSSLSRGRGLKRRSKNI